jgi:hypothetical protein
MISFFRKIRQKLLTQNRVTQYLVFTFGEITDESKTLLIFNGVLSVQKFNFFQRLLWK